MPEMDRSMSKRKGRPVPGYSLTARGEKVSDEQIKIWLLDLLEGEELSMATSFLRSVFVSNITYASIKRKHIVCVKRGLGILKKRRNPVRRHPRRLPGIIQIP